MRVRMKVSISGTRNGQPWPDKGGEVDLPDVEAERYCASGLAERVPEKPKAPQPVVREEPVETPVEVAVDQAPVEKAVVPEKRKPGRPAKLKPESKPE